MTIATHPAGLHTVIAITGRLGAGSELDNAVQAATQAGAKHLLFDCSALTYINSDCLRVFIKTARAMAAVQGTMALVAVPPSPYEVFEIAGLLPVFTFFPSIDAAVAGTSAAAVTDRTAHGVRVVDLHGRLDAANAAGIERDLAAITSEGVTRIVLNCAGLDYLSSAALRVFVKTAKTLKQRDGELILAALNAQVRDIFEISGLLGFFRVAATVDEALANRH